MKKILLTSGEEHFDNNTNSFVVDYEAMPFYREQGYPLIMFGATALSEEYFDAILPDIDLVIILGGPDIHPDAYGEKPEVSYDERLMFRDKNEILLVKKCIEHMKPLLGICRGMQIINIALGGSLVQDIKKPEHSQDIYGKNMAHSVQIEKGTFLDDIYKSPDILVNSFHTQGIKKLGEGLKVAARSPDDIIEAVYHEKYPVYGVLWHPEDSYYKINDENSQKLIRYFCEL